MAIRMLRVSGYRSLRDIQLRLGPLNVLVGPNGCGKTNLYRALALIAAAAEGRFARSLADEGGMPSALWAGERGKGPVRMILGATIDDFAYELQCGLPQLGNSMFALDPEIKEEHAWFLQSGRRTELLKRSGPTVWARDDQGTRIAFPMELSPSESALSELREPQRFPILAMLREEVLSWRFYHQFRTDAESPLRRPRAGCRTPVLDHEGRDLAAALQTIIEIGDRAALSDAIDRAFPGSSLIIEGPGSGSGDQFQLALQSPGFRRPFRARELSDGTLQYLCVVAALLSPRPPALLALNEPETSIHPELLPALAELMVRASGATQLWLTTHSDVLASLIRRLSGVEPIRLDKINGATRMIQPGEEALSAS